MEDEDFDNDSPIGQLIQRVNKLCKKPQIDSQLTDALDVFQDKVTKQKAYLNNGIFNINFAEAALFLQSCAELYGKKIDLFWDQLLEFHTRLIEYDCQDEQEKGKSVDSDAIKQLEERRNRYKRKKKFKLALGESNDTLEKFLFEKTSTEEKAPTFETDDDLYKIWRRFEQQSSEITRIPKAVYEQQTKMYRMKNYYIMKSEDYDIYDPEDGEFNTKYSRIPGWHVIQHIFEYNTQGLLPDKNNTIATLRLCCYLRAQFMRDRKIPFNAPYSQYKDEYLEFKKKFFEEEAKKWQNMPLDTMADLHRQLEYLAQKEREENEKDTAKDPPKKYWEMANLLHRKTCTIEDCIECFESSKCSIITISDSLDNSFDSSIVKEDMLKSELCVSLEKLPKTVVDPKLRQDSGFFELDESGSLVNTTNQVPDMNELVQSDTTGNACSGNVEATQESPAEVNSDITENNKITDIPQDNQEDGTQTTETMEETAKTNDSSVHGTDEALENVPSNENMEQNKDADQSKENIDPMENDDFDTRSILSDHDYCDTREQINTLTENEVNKQKSKLKNDIVVPMSTKSRIIPRLVTLKIPKENKIKDTAMGPPPPKKRKLSQKQIEKLMTSKIPPTNEKKFEKFFSLNYQPQIGEGDIQAVDYESDREEFSLDEILTPPVNDNDDIRSILSDHSYCHLPDEDDHLNDDTGFIDGMNDETLPENECDKENPNESGIVEDSTPDHSESQHRRREVDPEHEEEYRRLLAEMRESRRENGEGLQSDPEHERSERQKREQERLAAKARVERWKETINPILRNLKENDFDIHEYGTKVMEKLEVDETKPFKNIVDGKSSAEVVRYFIASLQLANTYNIEICGAKSGELSNDTFGVKLLKRDRYHEHLTEYHAPSEDTFRERLKRVRDLQRKEETETQGEPLHKRQCVEKQTHKKKNKSQRETPTDASIAADCSQSFINRSSKSSSNNPPNPAKGKNVIRFASMVEAGDPCTPSTSRSFTISSPTTSQDFCEELASAQLRDPGMTSSPQTKRQQVNVRSMLFR